MAEVFSHKTSNTSVNVELKQQLGKMKISTGEEFLQVELKYVINKTTHEKNCFIFYKGTIVNPVTNICNLRYVEWRRKCMSITVQCSSYKLVMKTLGVCLEMKKK